jgi:hypothetical protein
MSYFFGRNGWSKTAEFANPVRSAPKLKIFKGKGVGGSKKNE